MTENQKIFLQILKSNVIWSFPRVIKIAVFCIFVDWLVKAISAGDFLILAFTLLFPGSILILTVASGTFLEYSFYKKRGKFWKEVSNDDFGASSTLEEGDYTSSEAAE